MKHIPPLALAGLLAVSLHAAPGAQQPGANEEFARRQYESGLNFLQNKRYAEALKDLQAVVDSFGASAVADNALLQIAQYRLDIAREMDAAQTVIDRLLKDYPDTDSAPMAHVLAGRVALNKGRAASDLDAAMASFERVPRLFPGSDAVPAAGYYAGEAMRLVRRFDEAADRYRRVTMEYPRSIWAARASLGLGYCLVQQDRAVQSLPQIQWVRQQFPNSPVAAEALNLNTIIYRLYLRAPAQPAFGFSGRSIGNERSDFKDVMGLVLDRDGRALLGHKGGVAIFDAKGAAAGSVTAVDPTAFFLDERNRIIIVRQGSMIAEKAETLMLSVPQRDGVPRPLEEIPSALATSRGDRLVSEDKARSVLRIAPDGKYLGLFAQSITPSRMVANGLDDVAMLDRSSKSISISDRDGKPLGTIARKGTGYELDDPADLAFDAFDQLYVLDRGQPAVLVFGPKYRFVASISVPEKNPGGFQKPVALALDPAGRLFIFDERAKRIQVYQ